MYDQQVDGPLGASRAIHRRGDSPAPSLSPNAKTYILPVFAGTLFLSALLLFSVQPIITKMILPHWGGSPAVWNTSVLFFQTVLFVGYLVAHGLGRLTRNRQRLIHLSLLGVAFIVLPIAIRPDAVDIGGGRPSFPCWPS